MKFFFLRDAGVLVDESRNTELTGCDVYTLEDLLRLRVWYKSDDLFKWVPDLDKQLLKQAENLGIKRKQSM